MPDLDFQVFNVESAAKGLTPLLHFKLRISNASNNERIYGVVLNAQIQLQPGRRAYNTDEKEKLVELFGEPKRWGETVRNRLWTHTNATVGAFTGHTETILPVPCTFDLNFASTKYFYALEGGDVSLLFLFSGSVFYVTTQGRLQVEPISWNKECTFWMPVRLWQELMETHYPNCAWLTLRRDVFDRLYAYKRDNRLASWEQVIEQLLPEEVLA